jgi:hypothetical protein
MEDELCVDTPHDVLCVWDSEVALESDECYCELIARVRADERRVYRSEIIGVVERTR